MKVALVYDRVNKFGGAERVLLDLHEIYPDAPLFTLVHNPKTSKWAEDIYVIPTFFNNLKCLRTRHELLAPVAAFGFETFSFDEYDVVISVTSSDAKAVITKPQTFHLCYCLTPTRYLWSGTEHYQTPFVNFFRSYDLLYSRRPDKYLAISQEVAGRIKKYYRRDSEVIYPGIDYDFFSNVKRPTTSDYYLVVGRQVGYKKTELVIEAFNQLKSKLLVVGAGSELAHLKSSSGSHISFVGHVTDEKLREFYAGAKALIFPQAEDFGLVPLEAQATGTPVIAFASGGALETVVDNETGVFFDDQSTSGTIKAVEYFESGAHHITADKCRRQAAKFDHRRFKSDFSAKVVSLWQDYQKSH